MISGIFSFGITVGEGESQDKKIVLIKDRPKFGLPSKAEEKVPRFKNLGIKVLQKYRHSVLIEATLNQMITAKKMGYRLQNMSNERSIYLKTHEVNTKKGAPDLQDNLELESYKENTKGLYLVHFYGNIHPDWRESLKNKGTTLLHYLPDNSYLVKMTPSTKKKIKNFDFVDWIGIYHPAYKFKKDISINKTLNVNLIKEASNESITKLKAFSEVLSGGKNSVDFSYRIKVDNRSDLEKIAHIRDVIWISTYNEPKLQSEMDTQIVGGFLNDTENVTPWRGEYGAYVNNLGYTGEGVKIGIADAGVYNHTDFQDRIIDKKVYGGAIIDPMTYEPEVNYPDGGYNSHGTHCAGIAVGNTYNGSEKIYKGTGYTVNPDNTKVGYYLSQGIACDSEIFCQQILDFDNSGDDIYVGPGAIDDDHVFKPFKDKERYYILKDAEGNGVYVHSNSIGSITNGTYIEIDQDYDRAVRDANNSKEGNQEMVIIAAAGNKGNEFGFKSITSPGTAKNVITVGSSNNYLPNADDYNASETTSNLKNVSLFSSMGRTNDERIKPTIVAPGHKVLSTVNPTSLKINNDGDEGNDVPKYSLDERYGWMSGTSMATPLVAGGAAVITEWYNETYGSKPSPAMVKALMINTADQLKIDQDGYGGINYIPNKYEGWGRLNLTRICRTNNQDRIVIDQKKYLENDEWYSLNVSVDNLNEPLKISLTWTDVEASLESDRTLKNNLNLKVTDPTGQEYYGNAFDCTGDNLSDSGWTYVGHDAIRAYRYNDTTYDGRNVVENIYLPPSSTEPNSVEDGTYHIKIHAENVVSGDLDGDGDPDQDFALVVDNADYAPDAEFSYSPDQPNADESVEFTDESSDPNGTDDMSWEWDFGDGSTSNQQNPTHSYDHGGTYTIKLNVTDTNGNFDTYSDEIYINKYPTVDFSYEPNNPKTDQSIDFQSEASDSDGNIESYNWDFGDESTSTQQNPTHSYSSSGTYTVTLTVTDDDGLTNTWDESIDVAEDNQPPDADFSYSPSVPQPYESVEFTDESSDPDGHIDNWYWEFGDGSTSTQQNPTHSYSSSGTYSVSLTVTDDDGTTDTCAKSITVETGGPDPYGGFEVETE